MTTAWVYKADGTRQCEPGGEITLAEMREHLETLIGKDNVLNEEKRTGPGGIITLCGAPTGQVNAYEITEGGLWLLFHGILGPMGFRLWASDSAVESVTAGLGTGALGSGNSILDAILIPNKDDPGSTVRAVIHLLGSMTEVGGTPTTLAELLGRRCRVYTVGDGLTKDWVPARVNIELGHDRRIQRIWFG